MTVGPQIEFGSIIGSQRACPCVLVLDTSGSMQGAKIDELNSGLQILKSKLMEDTQARNSIEIAIVTFGHGGVQLVQDFVPVRDFQPPVLQANEATPMGEAMHVALNIVRHRKATHRQEGRDYYRPWIFLITDGEPTDPQHVWQDAARASIEEQNKKGALVYCVAVGDDANLEVLARFSNAKPQRLQGTEFRKLFQWLSSSVSTIARARAGEQTALPPVDGWARVEV
ncbi:MAG TPA: VWA domain-containing protein [Anaeromyxobacteraceae bacterium]|nr:VWA domain-containing protein [Anaeromyxobacteraceae bacterium]